MTKWISPDGLSRCSSFSLMGTKVVLVIPSALLWAYFKIFFFFFFLPMDANICTGISVQLQQFKKGRNCL